jgi:hypothetical protein
VDTVFARFSCVYQSSGIPWHRSQPTSSFFAKVTISSSSILNYHIERRQNGKDGKFPVNAVHPQIVKSEQNGIGICRWRVLLIVTAGTTTSTAGAGNQEQKEKNHK